MTNSTCVKCLECKPVGATLGSQSICVDCVFTADDKPIWDVQKLIDDGVIAKPTSIWNKNDTEPEDEQCCAFMINAKGIEIVIGFYNKKTKEFECHINERWYDLDKIKCWQPFEFPGKENKNDE